MRIFRRKPDISGLIPEKIHDGQGEFVVELMRSCFKRLMNINKMEKEISSLLKSDEIQAQSKALGQLIEYLNSAQRGEEIAKNMYIAGVRALQKLDISEALAFAESLNGTINAVAAIRRMIGMYLLREDVERAIELLNQLPNDEWSVGTKKKIDAMIELRKSLLAEESDESKFFNILKQVDRPPIFQDVKMACLLDRFSFDCFSHEIELIPVSKSNWKSVLSRPDINYFLAESIWSGHDGGWQFAMSSFDTAAGDQLKKLLGFCKEEGIQSIFWNKEDPVNYDSFIEVAKHFDYIFTSDSACISKYKGDCYHDNVFSLTFAAQPIIHNPIRNSLPSHDVGFAGSWYIRDHGNRKRDTKILIDAASNYGLHIFDRFYGTDNRNRFPEEYNDFVKGSLTYKETCMAYRVYKIFLNVNSVDCSPTMFSRRVFEILASATALVSTQSVGMQEMLPECISVVTDYSSAKYEIDRLLNNEFERNLMAFRGYREVMNNHTYSNRLREIFTKVGIDFGTKPKPMISCICVSNRPHLIEDILDKFDLQTYQNKELILVIEADDDSFSQIKQLTKERKDIILQRAFEHEILGALLNKGVELSRGDYVAKWDDDDLYGPEYLSDSMLAFNYSSADVVGKLESYMYHQGTDSMYLRFENKRFRYQHLILGPTIIARRSVFDVVQFQERSVSEDTNFLKDCVKSKFKIFATDPYNFVYWRAADKSKHTWQPEDDELLRNTRKVTQGLSTDEVFI